MLGKSFPMTQSLNNRFLHNIYVYIGNDNQIPFKTYTKKYGN